MDDYDKYPSPLMFVFGALAVMSIIERLADVMHDRRAAAQSQIDAIFMKWHTKASINSIYGKFGTYSIDKTNTEVELPRHNNPINTRSPAMNTSRHQFVTVQAARAFYSKARANRMTRHGYYACTDSLKASLVRHERFIIGSVAL